MRQIKLALVLLLVAFGTAGNAAAQLYGIDVPGNLFTIDVSTGAGTLVGVLPDGPWGNPGLPGYNEIAYDDGGGQAWAQQRNGSFQAQEFEIMTAAGIGAPIPNGASWHGMEFVDGTLYAAGFAGIFVEPTLATLDPSTGLSTVIGTTGTASPITGMAFDPDSGVMYGVEGGSGAGTSTLYTLDLTTGAATAVGSTGMVAGTLSFGPDGNLYAGGVSVNQGDLYQIDTATGAGTLVGATGFGTGMGNGISGLTLVPVVPDVNTVEIPTLSTFGAGFLALMLLGIGMAVLRRRVV